MSMLKLLKKEKQEQDQESKEPEKPQIKITITVIDKANHLYELEVESSKGEFFEKSTIGILNLKAMIDYIITKFIQSI